MCKSEENQEQEQRMFPLDDNFTYMILSFSVALTVVRSAGMLLSKQIQKQGLNNIRRAKQSSSSVSLYSTRCFYTHASRDLDCMLERCTQPLSRLVIRLSATGFQNAISANCGFPLRFPVDPVPIRPLPDVDKDRRVSS